MNTVSILFYAVVSMCIIARVFHIIHLRSRYHELCIFKSQRKDYARYYNRDVYIEEMSPVMVWISLEEAFQFIIACAGIMSSQAILFIAIIVIDMIPSSRKFWVYTRTVVTALLMLAAIVNKIFNIIDLPFVL